MQPEPAKKGHNFDPMGPKVQCLAKVSDPLTFNFSYFLTLSALQSSIFDVQKSYIYQKKAKIIIFPYVLHIWQYFIGNLPKSFMEDRSSFLNHASLRVPKWMNFWHLNLEILDSCCIHMKAKHMWKLEFFINKNQQNNHI